MSPYKKVLYFFCSTCRPNSSTTVRYAFPVVLGAIAILSALTISSSGQTYIEIIPSKTSVQAGDLIALDVFVTAHKPINAVDISLDVPESQLKVTGIDTGLSVITLWTEAPYVKNGVVYLSGGTFRRGFQGRHLIATINAQAINSGLAYVNVTNSLLLAGDGTASEIKATDRKTDEVKLFIGTSDSVPGDALAGEVGVLEANIKIMIVPDIDGDGIVTLNDISRFMAGWTSQNVIYDFNGDGKMTFKDFAIILAKYFFR